jgi:hypothetical protein
MADDGGILTTLGGLIQGAVSKTVGFFDNEPPTPPTGTTSPIVPADWRGRLVQPASFRGVPFYVEEHSHESGRRWQHFEYPGRDLPYSEDLGRTQRRFALRAYVIGSDYMGTRDRLLAALETAGVGRLVHPYLGELNVCLDAYRTREADEEGGICRFDLSFAESSETAAPIPIEAPGASLLSGANGLLGAAGNWFEQEWKTLGVPDFVNLSALKDLSSLGDVLGWMGVPGLPQSQILNLLRFLPTSLDPTSIEHFVTQAASMVAGSRPVSQALTLLGILGRVKFPITGSAQSWGAQTPPGPATPQLAPRDLPIAVPPPVPPTPSRYIEAQNSAALSAYVNQVALASMADPISVVPLTSYDDLVALRSWLVDLFDDVEVGTTADVSRALASLRSTMIRELTRRGTTLQPLRAYATPAPLPAVVLAQRLYQDPTRDAELVARVGAVHPGFMPLSGEVAAT